MKVARRRFFGLAAAPVIAKAAPAVLAPMVQMAEADIAPVVTPFNELFFRSSFSSQEVVLSVADYMDSYIRPKMLKLAHDIDREVYKAMGRPDLVGKV